MPSARKRVEPKDKVFVVFWVDGKDLQVSRYSGDSLIAELERRLEGKFPERDNIRKYASSARVGRVISYAIRQNYAIVREI